MLEELVKDGIKNIPPYIPGDTAESVIEKYGIKPEDILKLASNENQFGCSPKALEAMEEELTKQSVYPSPFCIELRKKLGIKYGFDDSGDNAVIAVGASGILSLLGEVFIRKGDEVIFCEPTFGAYASAVRRNDGTSVALPLTKDLLYDLDGIYDAITEKTKMICICNPNNPTGTAVDSRKLREFIHKVPKNIIIVVDEAYIECSSNPAVKSMISEISDDTNVVVVRTFSKIYGLAGTRIGYAMCNKEMHAILQKCTPVFVAPRYALAAALASLDDEEFVVKTKAAYQAGREYLVKEFTELGFYCYPSESNFIYVNTGYHTKEFAEECKKYGLIIRGNFEYSRITIGRMEQNQKMVEIIKKVVASGNVPKN